MLHRCTKVQVPILFIQIISGIMKSIGHYFTDMLKMQLTIIKELLFFYLILQVLTAAISIGYLLNAFFMQER